MSLRKQWHDLDRSTVRSAPDRYALYEVGDADGTTLGFGTGVLPDALRELPNTARESRPSREAGAFRPQSEPDAEQGVGKSLRDLFAHQKSSISGDGRESCALH